MSSSQKSSVPSVVEFIVVDFVVAVVSVAVVVSEVVVAGSVVLSSKNGSDAVVVGLEASVVRVSSGSVVG